jgi:hypothetical protein
MDTAELAKLIAAETPPATWWLVLLTGIIGGVLAITSTHAEKVNVISVIVHEAGHAAASVLCPDTAPNSTRTRKGPH